MHGPLNVKLKKKDVLLIVLIVTGSVDVTEPSILTSFHIYYTMTENRLRLTPAERENRQKADSLLDLQLRILRSYTERLWGPGIA